MSELFFLVGADVLASFDRWREPARVLELATLVVLRRDADRVELPPGVRARVLDTRRVDISSTEVRGRLRAGRSIRGFVPEPVEAYLSTTGLYRQGNTC